MDWLSLSLSSQDSLSNDAYEAVWPLSFSSLLGPPLSSRPSCQGKGAQVSTAAQVQQARLSPQSQHMGLGSAGLWWGHYLWKKKRKEEVSLTRAGLLTQPPVSARGLSCLGASEQTGVFSKVGKLC